MPLDRDLPEKDAKKDCSLITVNKDYFDALVAIEKATREHQDIKNMLFPKEKLIIEALAVIKLGKWSQAK